MSTAMAAMPGVGDQAHAEQRVEIPQEAAEGMPPRARRSRGGPGARGTAGHLNRSSWRENARC